MTQIRLIRSLSFHHFEIPAGTVIAVPADVAQRAVQREIAQYAEPQHAVIEPRETRIMRGRSRREP